MNKETIESAQIAGTPAENVKKYTVDGNNVYAEFWSEKDAYGYMKKYAKVDNGVKCIHTTVGFADFEHTPGTKIIKGHSTYHAARTIVRIFEEGLEIM